MGYIYRYNYVSLDNKRIVDLKKFYEEVCKQNVNKSELNCTNDLDDNIRKLMDEIRIILCKEFKGGKIEVNSKYFQFETYNKLKIDSIVSLAKKLRKIKGASSLGIRRAEISYIAFFYGAESDKVNRDIKGILHSEPKEYYRLNFDMFEYNNFINSYRKYFNPNNTASKVDTMINLGTFSLSYKYPVEALDEESFQCLSYNNNKRKNPKKVELKVGKPYLIKGINLNKWSKDKLLEVDVLNYNNLEEIESIENEPQGFCLKSIKPLNIEDEFKVLQVIDIDFRYIEHDKLESSIIDKDKIKSIRGVGIYNVGQGLCTALCDDNKNPIIFYDFGRGVRENICTNPQGIDFNFINKPVVVLSHVHGDHWDLLRKFPKAFHMKWIVPNQNPGVRLLSHYCTLAKMRNLYFFKKFELVDNLLNINMDIRFLEGNSTTRIHEHNNSIYKVIDLKRNEIVKRILIPGDTRYEYMDNRYMSNIDILCSTHHGGRYCDLLRQAIIPIPKNRNNNVIIYSYGKNIQEFGCRNNSHGHPSEKLKYSKMNWKNDKDTPSIGNIFINFYRLMDEEESELAITETSVTSVERDSIAVNSMETWHWCE